MPTIGSLAAGMPLPLMLRATAWSVTTSLLRLPMAMVYDQRGVCTDTRFLYDFRYTISGDRIQFKKLVCGTDGVIFNKYFRLEGTKLYLRDKANGEEVMYSNFYEENGLPFRP